jgi:anti-sigma factor RsiW
VSTPHDLGGPSGDHPDDLLSALLDDELSPGATADVEAHLGGCTACRDDLAGVAEARAALRGSPRLAAPPAFARDLVRARHRASRRGVAVALAAASVVVVAGLALAPTNPDTSAEHPNLALLSAATRAQTDLTPRTTTLVDAESGDRVPVVPAPTEGPDDEDDESFADRVGDAVGALLDAIGG